MEPVINSLIVPALLVKDVLYNNFRNYKQTPVLIIEKAKAIKDGFRHLMNTFYKLEKDHLLNTLTIPFIQFTSAHVLRHIYNSTYRNF